MNEEVTNDKTDVNEELLLHSISSDTELDKKLLEPMTYIFRVPGKEIRTQLAKAFNHWLQIPNEKLEAIIEIIRILHVSSIVIDDIEDNGVLRRGVPAAHSVYGIAHTINAANFALFIALEKVISLGHPEAAKVYSEQLLILHRGQGADIYWRDKQICPTETEYRIMIVRKTSGLFNLAIRLMQLFSECKENFEPLVDTLGLCFQIRDDYANLCDKSYHNGKGYCEDLSEGKFSFPVIHGIHSCPEDTQLINIVKQRPKDIEVKRQCIDLLDKLGSFNYTRKTLEDLNEKARRDIKRFGGNSFLIEILDKWMKDIIDKPKQLQ